MIKYIVDSIEPLGLRKPNQEEINDHLLSYVRTTYLEDRNTMSKPTYYYLKKHIKRGEIEYVLKYLDNIGRPYRSQLEKYASTPSVCEFKMRMSTDGSQLAVIRNLDTTKEELK